jgi:peptidoglycan/LPS O-acetylase OafA/YrhL
MVVEGFVNPQSLLIVVRSGAVIGLVAFDRLPLLRFRPLLFLGSISYPLYRLHQKVGDTIIYQLYRHGIDHPLLILGLPIAAAILLAMLVHYTVEVPSQHRLRAWRRRTDGAPAATPSVRSAVPPYNARQASSEEAPQWRQPRQATPSPVPVTTSRI